MLEVCFPHRFGSGIHKHGHTKTYCLNCPKNENVHLTLNCAETLLSRVLAMGLSSQGSNRPADALSLRPHQAELINGFPGSGGRCWRGVLLSDN